MDRMPHVHEGKKGKEGKARTLAEISVTVWLTPENASFFSKNGFLCLRFEEKEQRVFLCRQFPFELLWEFISVLDEDQNEIGIIRRLSDFEDEAKELIETELKRRYYTPTIQRIVSVKERYGFSYWKVITETGEVGFTLHDTYRSIIRAGENRLFLFDVDGNRFEIPDTLALDRKSHKKIELYL